MGAGSCIPKKQDEKIESKQEYSQDSITDYDRLKLKLKQQMQTVEKQTKRLQLEADKQMVLARESLQAGDKEKAAHYLQAKKMYLQQQKNASNQYTQLLVAYNNLKTTEAAKMMNEALQQCNTYMKSAEVQTLQSTLQDVLAESAQYDQQVKQIEALMGMGYDLDIDDDLKLLQEEIAVETSQKLKPISKENVQETEVYTEPVQQQKQRKVEVL
ncbi:Conserved_hypothetical protein [Hexamita inflata]|uniref:Uncharacterized protein n=1 Tax=Hexamita inflata TaxID=28002 RepID=A0AA86TRH2_9EUKA|nr:Conserved hypothetical protein [Hexamita inflata]CAI9935796.1 Conserved hypothetical protein [Hexamita inflata]